MTSSTASSESSPRSANCTFVFVTFELSTCRPRQQGRRGICLSAVATQKQSHERAYMYMLIYAYMYIYIRVDLGARCLQLTLSKFLTTVNTLFSTSFLSKNTGCDMITKAENAEGQGAFRISASMRALLFCLTAIAHRKNQFVRHVRSSCLWSASLAP